MRLYIFSILFLVSACRKKVSTDPLTTTLTREEAQQDLKLLRDLLEDAHPSLTEYMSEKRKDYIFDSLYNTLPEKTSLRDYFKKITFIANEIGCSHTYTELPDVITDTLYNRKLFLPFPTILLNNKLYINSDNDLPHGSRIMEINGITAQKILDSLAMYNSVDGYHRSTQQNAAAADFAFDYFIHFGTPDIFEVLVEDTAGKTKTVYFEPVTLNDVTKREEEKYYFDATDDTYSFYISEKDNYARLRLTDFDLGSDSRQVSFESFLKNSFELLSYKKNITTLVIDLRENTGGSLYNCFLLHSYLSKNAFSEYRKVFTRISKIPYQHYLTGSGSLYDTADIGEALKTEFLERNASGYFIPDSLLKVWQPDKYRFSGAVYIITNFKVASAASYFTLLSKYNSHAKIVGYETAGGGYSGNGFRMLKYQLPFSGIKVAFPYAKMMYSFGEPKTGRGLLPDYFVPDTYEAFKKNEDLQLNFITDSILSKNR
jgi:Peptidase family S41